MKVFDKKYDCIVIGGGFAGSAAAVAAARGGAKVLLVERINALGGAPCTMAVNPFMNYYTRIPETGESKRLSCGIFEEIENSLRGMNAMNLNSFNPEYLKLILNRMMQEAGVDLLFNSYFVSAEREGDKIISVTVVNKSGLVKLHADYFIDCTGDADVVNAARFKTRTGRPEDGLCQPMTLCFLIGGVDSVRGIPDAQTIVDLWLDEKKKGHIKNPMDGIMVFRTTFPGIYGLNATRMVKYDPTNAESITDADLEGREQMFELLDFFNRRVPGFENASILSSAVQTGVRESRMTDGEHILTGEELVACTKFDDAIACGNYDIDIHNPEGSGTSHYYFPDGQYYTIPYRSLIPKGAKNLLVAGRCISVTHEAQASIRIMPIVCTIGEAAGTAAAIAAKTKKSVADIDIALLRDTLRLNGACVD